MTACKWWKLDDGTFGVSGSVPPPAKGELVEVLSKSGKLSKVTIDKVTVDRNYWKASIIKLDDDGNVVEQKPRTVAAGSFACPHCGQPIGVVKS